MLMTLLIYYKFLFKSASDNYLHVHTYLSRLLRYIFADLRSSFSSLCVYEDEVSDDIHTLR